ncbi:SCO1664 family protein [Aeromicrobium panaciterrae]|uniref:SCO1664 family protein n=1 Tax=Aeromicrobium panaciterrae TaxID=363861 RepID=UPI0031D66A00
MTDLVTDELVLTSRIMPASNATFVGHIGDTQIVYKPVAGERPLWDFPDGNLARREAAAYVVSEAFGWDIVPRTWLREGPMGVGMVQLWRDVDQTQNAVDLVPADAMRDGWHHVLDGLDVHDKPVSLIHEDSPALRRMAVFDIVVNNADRKGGHVLEMIDGHRHGIDHGLTFHADHKLRTVLWGWIDDSLDADELAGVERVRTALDAELGSELAELITADELAALSARCDRLLTAQTFPAPSGDMPAVPWPPF